MKDVFAVFDLFGTLTDASHRANLAEARQWDAWRSAAIYDEPNFHVCSLLLALSVSAQIVIIAEAEEKDRIAIENWLDRHHLSPVVSRLILRNNGDRRKAHEFKIEEISKLRFVWLVVEDDEKITEELRNNNIAVIQVTAQPGAAMLLSQLGTKE